MSQTTITPSTTSLNYGALATVPTYGQAQGIVDQLSDAKFPVENVRVVGTGLRTVEQVTGRMTYGKAALYGAGAGAWMGLLLGLLLGIFTVGAWGAVVLWGVVLGALWGAVFGLIGHALTGGRRDFRSVQGLEAEAYDVLVEADHLGMAQSTLNQRPAA